MCCFPSGQRNQRRNNERSKRSAAGHGTKRPDMILKRVHVAPMALVVVVDDLTSRLVSCPAENT